ncbi:hypothetical protein FRC03_001415 [Tulasnella sp. 419]|nr:hypothetical protein FRC03_001415 [Tulasnella sp. 419]
MSETTARVLTNPSNRANPKIAKGKSKANAQPAPSSKKEKAPSKVAYRGVLDNPLRVEWPVIPSNLQLSLLSGIVELLKPLQPYHIQREVESRKKRTKRPGAISRVRPVEARKGEEHQPKGSSLTASVRPADKTEEPLPGRKRKHREDSSEESENQTSSGQDPTSTMAPSKRRRGLGESSMGTQLEDVSQALSASTSLSAPEIFSHAVFGVNEVTRRLESQSQLHADASKSGTSASSNKDAGLRERQYLRLVVVNREDVSAPSMIAHIPQLIAACNARPSFTPDTQVSGDNAVPTRKPVLLLTLPRDSENKLSEATGLRRMTMLAFDNSSPGLARLDEFLHRLPVLKAPWLSAPSTSSLPRELVPTHIKQLKSTTPKDRNAARDMRARGKAEAAKMRLEKQKLGLGSHTIAKFRKTRRLGGNPKNGQKQPSDDSQKASKIVKATGSS